MPIMARKEACWMLLCLVHVCCCLMILAARYEPRIPKLMTAWPYGERTQRLWDKGDLPSGVTYRNPVSLHGLLKKLSAGQPIKVVALGSSVTADLGGCWGSNDTVAKYVSALSDNYLGGKCQLEAGWLRWFMMMINTYWPHPDHVLINNGVPAFSGHNYAFGACVEETLPKDADLIIFEQVVDLKNSLFNRGLDHLIWRLRHHFSGTLPPLALLQTRRMTENVEIEGCFRDENHCGLVPTCSSIPRHFMEPHYTQGEIHNQEDFINGLASYYGLAASFSVRDWYHAALKTGIPERKGLTNCQFLSKMLLDVIHPDDQGRLLFSDWLTMMMIDAEESLSAAVDATTSGDVANAVYTTEFPTASMVPGADSVQQMRCYGILSQVGTGASTKMDIRDDSHGWEFVEYQVHGENTKYKPGWVTQSPGSTLFIKIDTFFPGLHPKLNATAAVSYLRSYMHMGLAMVSCRSGCQCDVVTLDGNWNDTRTSQIHLHEFPVTQHKECVIQIKLLDSTYSLDFGHKFKVTQMLSKAVIPRVTDVLLEEQMNTVNRKFLQV